MAAVLPWHLIDPYIRELHAQGLNNTAIGQRLEELGISKTTSVRNRLSLMGLKPNRTFRQRKKSQMQLFTETGPSHMTNHRFVDTSGWDDTLTELASNRNFLYPDGTPRFSMMFRELRAMGWPWGMGPMNRWLIDNAEKLRLKCDKVYATDQ